MVVNGHGQDFLRLILSDDVIIEDALDFGWLREEKIRTVAVGSLPRMLFGEKRGTELDAFIADQQCGTHLAGVATMRSRTLNQTSHRVLALAAERTLPILFALRLAAFPKHVRSPADEMRLCRL